MLRRVECAVFGAVALLAFAGCGEDTGEAAADAMAGDVVGVQDAAGATDALNDVFSEGDAGDGDALDSGADAVLPSDRELAGAVEFFVGVEVDPDVRTERLCTGVDDPTQVEDKVNIDCELEGGVFAPVDLAPERELTVLVWNMERGLQYDAQLEALRLSDALPAVDVLLLSELDRGCSRTGYRNVARELAQGLGMNYVFVTEFVELPRASGSGGTIAEACEHGNAILSRYPLANVGSTFHRQNHVWYGESGPEATGEPRLGGRVLLWADVVVGEQLLRAYTLHYESNPVHQPIQIDQAAETAELGSEVSWQVVIGGDTNNVQYFLDLQNGTSDDPTVAEFFAAGYVDAHAVLPVGERGTRNGLVIDLLWGNADFFSGASVCPRSVCAWSDHQPVWATVTLDGEL